METERYPIDAASVMNGAKSKRYRSARYIAESIRRTVEAWPTKAKRSIAKERAGSSGLHQRQ